MKKITISCLMIAMAIFCANSVKAQFDPYDEEVKMLTAGIGFSDWGVPIFVRFEMPVHDNITAGVGLSYQGKTESYAYFGGTYKYKYSNFGIIGRGDYHFNELLEADDVWDVYAGLDLGYFVGSTKFDGTGADPDISESAGGFSLGFHIGGRYFFKDNLGANLEFGGGTYLLGGTIGITYLF